MSDSDFLFPDPIALPPMIGILVYQVVNTLLFLPGAFLLLKYRKERVLVFRSAPTLLLFVSYLYVFSLVETASLLVGKPRFCEVSNAFYAMLPFFLLHFIMVTPMLVLQSDISHFKVLRSAQAKLSTFYWIAHRIIKMRVRILLMCVVGPAHVGFYLLMRYFHPLSGDCIRVALMSYAIHLLIFLGFIIYFLVRLLTVSDPFFLRLELFTSMFVQTPAILLIVMYPLIPQIFPPWFDFRWVYATISLPVTILNLWFPLMLTNKSFLKKMECFLSGLTSPTEWKELETKGTIYALSRGLSIFQVVLSHPTLLEEFTQFTVEEWSVENVLFYKAVEEFKVTYQENPRMAQERAEFIYNEFIKPGGHIEINIDSHAKRTIGEALQAGKVTENVFAQAQREVYQLMERDSFPKWQKTEAFKNALEKVIAGKSQGSSTGGGNSSGAQLSKRPSVMEELDM